MVHVVNCLILHRAHKNCPYDDATLHASFKLPESRFEPYETPQGKKLFQEQLQLLPLHMHATKSDLQNKYTRKKVKKCKKGKKHQTPKKGRIFRALFN